MRIYTSLIPFFALSISLAADAAPTIRRSQASSEPSSWARTADETKIMSNVQARSSKSDDAADEDVDHLDILEQRNVRSAFPVLAARVESIPLQHIPNPHTPPSEQQPSHVGTTNQHNSSPSSPTADASGPPPAYTEDIVVPHPVDSLPAYSEVELSPPAYRKHPPGSMRDRFEKLNAYAKKNPKKILAGAGLAGGLAALGTIVWGYTGGFDKKGGDNNNVGDEGGS
ncbi:hypothetical protein EV361DRAFT_919884 [Lentinula raphanica]|uniref:Uncharacterized protein n=1 Tax=Lentinula raphanica TaxID=153919 RepID=A0AA38NYC9_9AGAR|nr:hypothetical protein F5880DRAFT_1096288 [Lentinula raphanica]KAJ3832899.1 hypothetical protein F5878DRAFT_633958 [Lentinula raphanica]KAJ3969639.1 hypothetical protein EV361DRAFT_919884 [Lentinula raphanica]